MPHPKVRLGLLFPFIALLACGGRSSTTLGGGDYSQPNDNFAGVNYDAGAFPDSAPPDAGSDATLDAGPSAEELAVEHGFTYFLEQFCEIMMQCCLPWELGSAIVNERCWADLSPLKDEAVAAVPRMLALGLKLDQRQLDHCASDSTSGGDYCAPVLPDSCVNYWIGSVETGDPCEISAQCASQKNAEVACAEVQGQRVCTARVSAQVGEPCAWTCKSPGDRDCVASDISSPRQGVCYATDDLHCAGGVCQVNGAVGAACTGLDCQSGTECRDNVCTASDAACGGDGITPACADTNYCSADGTCNPKKPDSEACVDDNECLTKDCGYAGCGSGVEPFWLGYCLPEEL